MWKDVKQGDPVSASALNELARAAQDKPQAGIPGFTGPDFTAVSARSTPSGTTYRMGRALQAASAGDWFQVREYRQPKGKEGSHPKKKWTDEDRVTGEKGLVWVYARIGDVGKNSILYFETPTGGDGYEVINAECTPQTDDEVESDEGSPLE